MAHDRAASARLLAAWQPGAVRAAAPEARADPRRVRGRGAGRDRACPRHAPGALPDALGLSPRPAGRRGRVRGGWAGAGSMTIEVALRPPPLLAFTPYPRQDEFFAAGAAYRERLFMAGNQLGKSLAGAVEVAYHLTGDYPSNWQGRRF